jgi:ABC-type transporter Mla subunit MlaD
VAVIAFALILLGAPGLFRPLAVYRIYVDNAAAIKLGAPVMLAGRKIGQVHRIHSPVSREEEQRAQEVAAQFHPAAPTATPSTPATKPKYEARIDVQVDRNSIVFRDSTVRLMQLGLLGEMAIDFTQGTEGAGRARDGEVFAGERTPDFSEAASKMLEVIKPVASEATSTMKELQNTAQNLSRLTEQNSDLTIALGQFKTFGEHLVDLTAPNSPLSLSLKNIEKLSTDLTANDNITVTLRNFRDSSERLRATMRELGPVGENIRALSETVKAQPWRLVWPSTVKYPEDEARRGSREQTITVRKSSGGRPAPRATPGAKRRSR